MKYTIYLFGPSHFQVVRSKAGAGVHLDRLHLPRLHLIQVYTWVPNLHLALQHLGLPGPVPFTQLNLQRGIARQLLSSLIASTHVSYVPWDRGISCLRAKAPSRIDQSGAARQGRLELHLTSPVTLVMIVSSAWDSP